MKKIKKLNEKLHIEYIDINLLHPSPLNPRTWTEKATNDIKTSITRFGLTEPLIVNSCPTRKNRIISGHFRWTVAKNLGLKTVPVIYLNISSLKKERELLLRMNANQGAWNYELLKSFDVGMLLNVGFDDSDLSNIWDDALGVEDDDWNIEKEIQKIKKTDIKIGDRFALGRHMLSCSDGTNLDAVKALTGKIKVNMINIDVPYNIGLNYNSGIGGKKNYGGRINDNKTDKEYRSFLKSIVENGLSVSQNDCHAFVWCDEKYIGMLQQVYENAGLNQKRICIWIKGNQNPTPQIAFNKMTEFCLYGIRKKPYLSNKIRNLNEIMNKEATTGNRLIDDVMDLLNIWMVKRLAGNQYEHPTQKPVTLYEKALRRCSRPGDIILDLCAGSGSLMVACEQLKRVAYLVEIEPIFCQLIINRYEKLTKTKAKKIN